MAEQRPELGAAPNTWVAAPFYLLLAKLDRIFARAGKATLGYIRSDDGTPPPHQLPSGAVITVVISDSLPPSGLA
jgi:hypothetical protein